VDAEPAKRAVTRNAMTGTMVATRARVSTRVGVTQIGSDM